MLTTDPAFSGDIDRALDVARRAILPVPLRYRVDPTFGGGIEQAARLTDLPAGLYVVTLDGETPWAHGPFGSLGEVITDLYEGATEGPPKQVGLLTVSRIAGVATMVRLFDGPDTDHVAPEYCRSLSYGRPPWAEAIHEQGRAAERRALQATGQSNLQAAIADVDAAS